MYMYDSFVSVWDYTGLSHIFWGWCIFPNDFYANSFGITQSPRKVDPPLHYMSYGSATEKHISIEII